jgi:hypothetical protein
MRKKANEWLDNRRSEMEEAAKKGKDGKHPESPADQDKRTAIADLLVAIEKELPIVGYAETAVEKLGISIELVRELPPKAIQYLVDADRALDTGDVARADSCFGEVSQELANAPGADRASDEGMLKLIKSSLMRKNVGQVRPAIHAALTDPKYRLDDPAEIRSGADKAQSLATGRITQIDALTAKHRDGSGLAEMPDAERIRIETMIMEGRLQKPTLENLKGAAGGLRAAKPAPGAEKSHKKTFATLTDEEASAIIGYSTNLYPGFNGPLRAGIHQLTGDEAALTKLAVSGLNKLPPYTGQVYRHGQNFNGYARVNRVGAIVSDMAFLSTAGDQKGCVTGGEYHEVLEVLKSKTGRDVSPLSAFGKGEAEVLFRPGTQFRVTKVARKDKDNAWPDKETMLLATATPKKNDIQMVVFKEEL